MRKTLSLFVVLMLAGAALSGGDDGRAIVAKSITAAGGEAKLKKFHAMTWTETGTYYGMGEGLPYTGKYAVHYPDQFHMEIQGVFTMCLNGESGWINANGEIKDMSKEQVASERINHRAGAIASLIPLKNKDFTVKAAGAGKVGDKEAVVVEVSRKDYPTVKLYFDKKTELLIRSEWKSKASDMDFKEVAMEMTYSNYKEVEGCKMPHTMSLKRDGKKFVEADISDLKSGHVDSKIFAKPSKN
jgi:outer membrane lipoprotein-sorting protein